MNITSPSYAEYMQLLKYEVHEKYDTHHDQNSPRSSVWGERIYTVFVYLNDDFEGGQTHFPQLNITIKPQKGTVLLWPSMASNNTHTRDQRTEHQSLPVTKGTKFAANFWIHLYPFRPFYSFCDNTAYLDNWI